MSGLLDVAAALTGAGCCVIPARPDGSKAPAVRWEKYQIDLPSDDELQRWFSNGNYDGLGVVCGAVSGGLEMLEFEGRAIGMVPELGQLMTDHGVDELWSRLLNGYVEMTPSGGLHFLYRVTDGPAKRNTKLARRPATAEELAENPDDRVKVLLETRGEGGFTITAPSGGRTHPSGEAWRMIAGGPATIPAVTADERDELYAIAVMLDQMPAADPLPTFRGDSVAPPNGELRPGDDYNLRAQWDDILIPHGWQPTHKTFNSGGRCWTRPGKEHGISATTGTASDGVDRLYVFSSSTSFEPEKPYSKFAAYAHLNHGGNISAAAGELRRAGYGGQREPGLSDISWAGGDRPFSSPESASTEEGDPEPDASRLRLTWASQIAPKRVRWLWHGRIAQGTLSLLAGREGLGKSTLAYHLAGEVTRGSLQGEDYGKPRVVLVCANEDSWEHTIVPRLIAAGADLGKVARIDAVVYEDVYLSVALPRDNHELEQLAAKYDAGLLILDPLMSVVDGRIDTHIDRQVRTALEPLVALGDRTRMSILGLIHHNKGSSTDPLNMVMASKAFTAVARSVHTCIADPDDDTEERRLFATTKNNLGQLNLPVLGFAITSFPVETADDGTAWTGKLHWTGEVEGKMQDLMSRANDDRGAVSEAAEWLDDYLVNVGGCAPRADIERAGKAAGHGLPALKRAKERLHVTHRSEGYPRRTFWELKESAPVGSVGSTGEPTGEGMFGTVGSNMIPLSQLQNPQSAHSPGETLY